MFSDCSIHVIFRKQECEQGLALALAYTFFFFFSIREAWRFSLWPWAEVLALWLLTCKSCKPGHLLLSCTSVSLPAQKSLMSSVLHRAGPDSSEVAHGEQGTDVVTLDSVLAHQKSSEL